MMGVCTVTRAIMTLAFINTPPHPHHSAYESFLPAELLSVTSISSTLKNTNKNSYLTLQSIYFNNTTKTNTTTVIAESVKQSKYLIAR